MMPNWGRVGPLSKREHTESAIYAMIDLPQPITLLVDELATMRGAAAVVLGGSRAVGSSDTSSDWHIGLYYRGAIDLAAAERSNWHAADGARDYGRRG
jgi:hypothetical protein